MVLEKRFSITGTFHGSIIYARTEGIARRKFHQMYNGESIVNVVLRVVRVTRLGKSMKTYSPIKTIKLQ